MLFKWFEECKDWKTCRTSWSVEDYSNNPPADDWTEMENGIYHGLMHLKYCNEAERSNTKI